jgi:uncharacterized membrane protein HdeD (DUF308 family)
MGALTVTTLGAARVLHDGVDRTILMRKVLGLAVYLAVTDQPHARAHLGALLWPDADEAHSLLNLRQTLLRLRQALGYALALPETLAHPFWAALSGALSVVFGVLLAVWPKSGETALVWLIGIYAIAYGLTLLYYAFLLQAARSGARAISGAANRLASGQAQG